MAMERARDTIGRIFLQRCFYLFAALLVMVAAAPLIEPTPTGKLATNVVQLFIIVAAVAAVGRSVLSFVIALLLAAPTLSFQWLSLYGGFPEAVVLALGFGTALYVVTLVYLLQYVFRRDVMTADKLYGAAAAYLMLGIVWAFGYAFINLYYPHSFAVGGAAAELAMPEFIYFSFTVLTSTGFGDLTPLSRQARSLCIVEQLIGALFVAILIARLAGVYPASTHGRQ